MTAHALRQTRYREWLESHGLRFGFAAELAALATRTRGPVTNDTPAVEKWHLILPTVRLVEQVRDRFGPTTIQSAYRALPYNVAVGGVTDSQHARNTAIDFSCREGTPRDWALFLRGLRDAGQFRGGVGIYGRQGFVHVDTRGTNADWQQ